MTSESEKSTRVLLINPGMDLAAGFGEFASVMEPMPCLGMASLAASLKKAGHSVRCVDAFATGASFADLLREIDDFKAGFVGQSCLTPTAKVAFSFNDLLKRERPHIQTVLGNVHASEFAKEIVDNKQADYVLDGECEQSLPMLLDSLESNASPEKVPGLHYLSDSTGLPAYTGPPLPIMDLDALPNPDWKMLPWERYTFLPFVTVGLPVVAIMGSRGCPYRCTFCALKYQGKYRTRSPLAIAEEMEQLVVDFKPRHVGFVDPIYPLKKDHLFELCGLIRQKELHLKTAWTSETRVDVIDKEMMIEMKASGYRRLLLGVESGEDRLLKVVEKNYEIAQVKQCVAWAKEVGLETSCFFILGLPTETAAESRKTMRFPIELDVDFAKFSILVPLPGSPLFNELVSQGKLRTSDWEKFTTFNPSPEDLPFVPEGMTGEELLALQKKANMMFYFRPRIILRHLFSIRTIPFKSLFAGLRIWLRWRLLLLKRMISA
jgi:radical SAM superfamily enzyme YgiQ (UPF0313 family)